MPHANVNPPNRSDSPDTDSRPDVPPVGPSHATGLDIIGHAEQVDLVARLLADRDAEDRGTRVDDDLAAPFYGGNGVFEGSWSAAGDGGSWGMPPTVEELGKEAARRRRESETRSVTQCHTGRGGSASRPCVCCWRWQVLQIKTVSVIRGGKQDGMAISFCCIRRS